jgi:hypothetical protein
MTRRAFLRWTLQLTALAVCAPLVAVGAAWAVNNPVGAVITLDENGAPILDETGLGVLLDEASAGNRLPLTQPRAARQ